MGHNLISSYCEHFEIVSVLEHGGEPRVCARRVVEHGVTSPAGRPSTDKPETSGVEWEEASVRQRSAPAGLTASQVRHSYSVLSRSTHFFTKGEIFFAIILAGSAAQLPQLPNKQYASKLSVRPHGHCARLNIYL